MEKINFLAVLAAAVSTFLIGGLWYSKALFGKAWMKENNLTDEQLKTTNSAKIFGLSFLFSLFMAFNLAMFVSDPEIDFMMTVIYSLCVGLGWIAFGLAIIALFELRSWKYIFINGGYMTIAFLIQGIILGAWK
ncbi:MAG: DUF1761 domain-containing protein [Fimbriimonadaceae bacterium]|nr:DUF1761 domain-containing protein [Chitinophagales bacterium]